MTDLIRCVEEGNTKAVLDILKSGGRMTVNTPNNDKERIFPLHVASSRGNVQMTELLLNHSAKVGCSDHSGLTPIHYASRGGHKDALLTLLKQPNAVVDCQSKDCFTPLHFAALNRHTEIVKILCEYRANLEETDLLKCQTALHMACASGSKDIVEILLKNDAQVNIQDFEHQTPFELLQIKKPPPSPSDSERANYEDLSKDMKSILFSAEHSDITFIFDNPTEKIYAHKCLIKARAPALLGKDSKNQVIRISSMSLTVFRLLLEWIYTANIDIDEVDLDIAIELYNKAMEYHLPKLKTFVENVINSNIDEQTARTVLDVALNYKAESIITKCSIFIVENFKKIVDFCKSNGSQKLFSKEELLEIISHVDVIKNEIPILDNSALVDFKNSPTTPDRLTPSNDVQDSNTPQSNATFTHLAGGLKVKIQRPPATAPSASSARGTKSTAPATKKQSRVKPEKVVTEKVEKAEAPAAPEKKQPPSDPELTGRTLELCQKLIQQLMDDEKSLAFSEPVDYLRLNIPQYPLIIKHPMDLRTIKTTLAKTRPRDKYKGLREFASKVRLVFDNARTFNQCGSHIYNDADYMSKLFETKYAELQRALQLPKTFDPPKEFIPPPPVNASAPIIPPEPALARRNSQKDGVNDAKKTKRKTQTNTTRQTPRPSKKRKTSEEPKATVTAAERSALHENLVQFTENEYVMSKVMEIIHPKSTTQGNGVLEIDVASLPVQTIRKLQRLVKSLDSNNPHTGKTDPIADSDEDDDNDPDYQ